VKAKAYSITCMLGLSVGMLCFIIITTYITYELTYDHFHYRYNDIYRVFTSSRSAIAEDSYAKCPPPLADILNMQFEKKAQITRTASFETWIESNSKKLKDEVTLIDDGYFKIFNFTLPDGNKPNTFQGQSVIISSDVANKYYGNTDPIGKIMTINKKDYLVTGILHKCPSNTTLDYKILLPFSNIESFTSPGYINHWYDWSTKIYIKADNNTKQQISKYFKKIEADYIPENMKSIRMSFGLQSLTEVHLNPLKLDKEESNTKDILILLASAGTAILIITIINCINLTTANAHKRYKEIAVKKIIGISKAGIIYQILIESVILSIMAMLLAIVLIICVKPVLNDIIGKYVTGDLISYYTIIEIIIFSIIIGLCCAIYPAFHLVKSSAIILLQKRYGKSKTLFNRSVLIIQFTAVSIMLMSLLIIYRQTMYMKYINIGLKTNNIIHVKLDDEINYNVYNDYINKLKQIPGVKDISMSESAPGEHYKNNFEVIPDSWTDINNAPRAYVSYVDDNYINLYNIKMMKGRNFNEGSDGNSFGYAIINRAAEKAFGWKKSEPTGSNITFKYNGYKLEVIGVTEDYHYESPQNKIMPLILVNDPNHGYSQYINIEFSDNNMKKNIGQVKYLWDKQAFQKPFEYEVLDDIYTHLYKPENNMYYVTLTFSAVAVIISLYGLFSISQLVTNKRHKEMAIRKVLGASTISVFISLAREYILIVILSVLLSIPVVYKIMTEWLSKYPYKIKINYDIIGLPLLLIIIISLATISYNIFKVALSSPIKSIKHE
jgi:putative ABC transport system permease protein